MTKDVNVERIRKAREALLKRYDGLDGWVKHLQAMDRQRARTAKQKERSASLEK